MDIHYFHAASDQFQRRLAIWAVKVWAFCSRRILVWLHCPWRATTSALRLQFYRSETGRWGKCWRLLQEDCWVPSYSCFSACSGYQGRAYVHGDKTMNFQGLSSLSMKSSEPSKQSKVVRFQPCRLFQFLFQLFKLPGESRKSWEFTQQFWHWGDAGASVSCSVSLSLLFDASDIQSKRFCQVSCLRSGHFPPFCW